jgi:hypothetical protein
LTRYSDGSTPNDFEQTALHDFRIHPVYRSPQPVGQVPEPELTG